jgi:hypothetical protein
MLDRGKIAKTAYVATGTPGVGVAESGSGHPWPQGLFGPYQPWVRSNTNSAVGCTTSSQPGRGPATDLRGWGGPRAGATRGGCVGSAIAEKMRSRGSRSVMKAIRRIGAPRVQVSGQISSIRAMRAAHSYRAGERRGGAGSAGTGVSGASSRAASASGSWTSAVTAGCSGLFPKVSGGARVFRVGSVSRLREA